MLANIQDVITELGNPSAPSVITQVPFDYDPGHYERLCRPDTKPLGIDLYDYALDLEYEEIQKDLFLYLLPKCLSAWQENLMADYDSPGAIEKFCSALAKHQGFGELLSQSQFNAVLSFMRNAILDKIDLERGLSFSGMGASPYSWIQSIGTYGMVFPAVKQLWEEWWSCSTTGRACGVLQYASVLMYPDDKNPIFSPWTPMAGGGAPTLWETESCGFDHSWLPENVEFLRTTFTLNYLRDAISAAAVALDPEIDSSVPELMVSDFEKRAPFAELRMEELFFYLSLPLGEVREWATK